MTSGEFIIPAPPPEGIAALSFSMEFLVDIENTLSDYSEMSNASKSSKLSFEDILENNPPEAVHFVQIATDIFSLEFPDIWKLGQAYFQG